MTKVPVRHQIKDFFIGEYKALVSFVRGLIDDAADRDAEDIVQDVAFHLFEKGAVNEPIEHLAAYIYSSLRNRVIDSFRRKKPVQSLDAPVSEEEDAVTLIDVISEVKDDPQVQFERQDLFNCAMALIRQLPMREQAVIIATEMEGFTFAELSKRWNVPIGTLLSQKSRTLKKLKNALSARSG
jgi:RNA polymerase sigma factor (sigma-70 family)